MPIPCLCLDPDRLMTKLARFTPETTRVVTDCDSTITTDDGGTSWSLFTDSGLMPSEYVTRRNAYKDTYYPYEIDADMNPTLRRFYLREWWMHHLELLIEYKLSRDILSRIVIDSNIIRRGMDTGLRTFERLGIPVLVLSSGITNSIEILLESGNLLLPNIHIASNMLVFNDTGMCQGFDREHIIHVANKDEWDAPERVRETFVWRSHILLFGDSLDDIRMVASEHRDDTIAVGFCTTKRRHQRKQFIETFDLVVESNEDDTGIVAWLIERIARRTAATL